LSVDKSRCISLDPQNASENWRFYLLWGQALGYEVWLYANFVRSSISRYAVYYFYRNWMELAWDMIEPLSFLIF
jgi:hypothetical protein